MRRSNDSSTMVPAQDALNIRLAASGGAYRIASISVGEDFPLSPREREILNKEVTLLLGQKITSKELAKREVASMLYELAHGNIDSPLWEFMPDNVFTRAVRRSRRGR